MDKDRLDKFVNKYTDYSIRIRRQLHQNPELGMFEFETAKLIETELIKIGLEVKAGIGKNGVVGLLRGKKDGKTIALRADMDALSIEENTGLSFKSKNKGIMHACGHDAHVSILLGVAKILYEIKDEICGNIKFVFQPAEECNPDGGARFMIDDGILEDPKVDAAIALHVWDLPLGKIGTKPGVIMAQSDRVLIKIKGKSCHGSSPHLGTDAILAASYVVTSMQSIISRNIDPLNSAVITVGKINGGYRDNVVADEVTMEATVRSFDKKTAEMLPIRIEDVIKGVCQITGCDYEYNYEYGYPYVYNDDELTVKVLSSLKNSFSDDSIVVLDKPATGAEDFAFFSHKVPSVLLWLGGKSPKNKDSFLLHNPNFLLDEDCIPIGIKAMSSLALNLL